MARGAFLVAIEGMLLPATENRDMGSSALSSAEIVHADCAVVATGQSASDGAAACDEHHCELNEKFEGMTPAMQAATRPRSRTASNKLRAVLVGATRTIAAGGTFIRNSSRQHAHGATRALPNVM